ncbi:MAG TPA: hypothetical protein VG722_09460, partial [Tepidisphaeraceae bacterium]|nr:hypothetical protein [Tepidisphaeraceae bacterium]
MINKNLISCVAGLFLIAAASCSPLHTKETTCPSHPAYVQRNLVQSASPLYGTGAFPTHFGNNNCFPGAVAPFGMIQWSPDTESGRHKNGYFAADKRISDFSLDHLSGTGAPYGEDFAMMPILGSLPNSPPSERTAFAESFSHKNEIAR